MVPIRAWAFRALLSPDDAQRILERVERLSDEWGTDIDIEGSVGIIRVN